MKINCFSNEEKIRIIKRLNNKESAISELSDYLNIKQPTLYKYLQEMIKAGIVLVEKKIGEKKELVYKLNRFSLVVNPNNIEKMTKEENKISAIIFDFDDCLIRREDIPIELSKAGKNALREAICLLKKRGVSINYLHANLFSVKWIRAKYGNSISWFISTWLSAAGVPDGKIKDELTRKYVKKYFERIEHTGPKNKPFKDVIPFLKAAEKKKIKIAAMSNSSRKMIEKTLKENKIWHYFSAILGGDEIPKSMEAIEKLLDMLKVDKKNCLVVGDSGRDIEVGREAGIPIKNTIGVYRRITPIENLESIYPKVVIIKDLRELLKFI